jgi:tRNA threonylcarbamoyl adenosine modification protein YeaZ
VLVLAVDTATPAVTAGVVELVPGSPPRLLAKRVTLNAKAHGELLTPHISDSLEEAGHTFADLDAIVVGAGPGPFTGLRVGLVTAAALGQALNRPVYPVATTDAIAKDAASGHPLLVATDARRKEVYWAAYDAGVRTGGPEVARPEAVSTAGFDHAIGDGAHRYAEVLGLSVVEEPRFPSALALVELAADRVRAKAPGEPLTPLYLRRPDATLPGERKPALR